MSEYERTLSVEAPADQVFAFVSDVGNFPRYLRTVHDARVLEGQRIHVNGEAHGHPYESEGYFRVDGRRRLMEWSSEGPRGYSGWMQVDAGDVTPTFSEITVHLNFGAEPVSPEPTSEDERILEAMDDTLKAIEKVVADHASHHHKPKFT